MADPLKPRTSGVTHRTSRERARAHGTKVPATPSAGDYCGLHGYPKSAGSCAKPTDSAAVASTGGNAKLPSMKPPFKMGGR